MRMASMVGLEGVSIGGLSSALGLSKSGLFAHFKSKENLQIQILDAASGYFIKRVVLPAIKKPRGEPRVVALFENWMSWASKPVLPGGCIFVSAATEFDDRPGPVRKHLVQRQRDWLSALERAAAIAVAEQHFRVDLDVQQFAFHEYSLMLGVHHHKRLLEERGATKRAKAGFALLLENARI